MKPSHFLFAVLITSGIIYSPLAAAHRQHISWTAVEWNQKTRNLEVVHRIHEHDAQLLLAQQSNKPVDLTRLQDRALLAIYVENHFNLQISNNTESTPTSTKVLKLLGAELEDSYILVFQELKLDKPPASMTLHASLLMELFPDQINMINIKVNEPVTTLKFHLDDEAVVVDLL
jgi:hypothetical protein